MKMYDGFLLFRKTTFWQAFDQVNKMIFGESGKKTPGILTTEWIAVYNGEGILQVSNIFPHFLPDRSAKSANVRGLV